MREQLKFSGEPEAVSVSLNADGSAQVAIGDETYSVSDVQRDGGELSFTYNGKRLRVHVLAQNDTVHVTDGEEYYRFARIEEGAVVAEEDELSASLSSQMPGTVLKLLKRPGDSVAKGDVLLILEAMKMEHEISAPADGTLDSYPFSEGERVMPGDLLVNFTPVDGGN
jgi:3-methylcrotonyl-CoA carboxylase alpha subunit